MGFQHFVYDAACLHRHAAQRTQAGLTSQKSRKVSSYPPPPTHTHFSSRTSHVPPTVRDTHTPNGSSTLLFVETWLFIIIVWCGMGWCGVVRRRTCGVVWCGVNCVVLCGRVWCQVCGVVWCGVMCGRDLEYQL
jgi:hypothetical protein